MPNSKSKYMKRFLFLLMTLCSMCLSASAYVTAVIDGICYDLVPRAGIATVHKQILNLVIDFSELNTKLKYY